MKKIYTIAGAAIALLAISCSKDLGNYDFKPSEVISIEGLEKSYTKISGVDRLQIDPALSSTEGSADFDCFWGIYETSVQGETPKMDTISKTKTLDYLVKERAHDWMLVFCAKNKQTGFAQYKQIPLRVTTPSAGGWYVLKDDGSQSDIDLFKTPFDIFPTGAKTENMFSYYNGKKLEGKASFINYTTEYKAAEFGKFENTRTLFAGTDKDLSAISINTFKELKNLDGIFYEKPSVKAPGFLEKAGTVDYYLLNDGQLHGLSSIIANTGLFGARTTLNGAQNSPYKLSRYSTGAYFFDELSSSFLNMSDATAKGFTVVNDIGLSGGKPQTAMSAKNNNKKLLFMAGNCAYFQDKTDANLKILSALTLSTTAFKMVNDTIRTTSKLFNATKIAINQDENMIYFANGNEVWSRNLSDDSENRQYTIPAGEVITYIKHRKFNGTGGDAMYNHNYVVIGTTIGGNYKVRMFKKSSGNLTPVGNPTPDFTLNGTGSVGDVFFVR